MGVRNRNGFGIVIFLWDRFCRIPIFGDWDWDCLSCDVHIPFCIVGVLFGSLVVFIMGMVGC